MPDRLFRTIPAAQISMCKLAYLRAGSRSKWAVFSLLNRATARQAPDLASQHRGDLTLQRHGSLPADYSCPEMSAVAVESGFLGPRLSVPSRSIETPSVSRAVRLRGKSAMRLEACLVDQGKKNREPLIAACANPFGDFSADFPESGEPRVATIGFHVRTQLCRDETPTWTATTGCSRRALYSAAVTNSAGAVSPTQAVTASDMRRGQPLPGNARHCNLEPNESNNRLTIEAALAD